MLTPLHSGSIYLPLPPSRQPQLDYFSSLITCTHSMGFFLFSKGDKKDKSTSTDGEFFKQNKYVKAKSLEIFFFPLMKSWKYSPFFFSGVGLGLHADPSTLYGLSAWNFNIFLRVSNYVLSGLSKRRRKCRGWGTWGQRTGRPAYGRPAGARGPPVRGSPTTMSDQDAESRSEVSRGTPGGWGKRTG